MSVAIRRAGAADAELMVRIANHPEVEPFMGTQRARDQASVLEQIERSEREPLAFGRFVIEIDGRAGGVMGFERVNERNRIAHLEALALLPEFRGWGIADEAARLLQRHLLVDLDFHRLQLECYAFNDRAIRHAERAGFVREGVKRRAYLRHGEWTDGVMFALLREDLEG